MPTPPKTQKSVRAEGYAAQKGGTPKSANPYRGLRGLLWRLGWYKAKKGG